MSIEGATLEGAMLHTAFMLSVRGTPQLYSGEEIAMEGKDDPDNRRDFPGGFPGDKHDAFVAASRTRREQRMWQWTHDWLMLRREHTALRGGRLIDLFYDDDAYAYARADSREAVVIALNRSGTEKTITIPAAAIGARDGQELLPLNGANSNPKVTNGQAALAIKPWTAMAYQIIFRLESASSAPSKSK
jgi:glycosidase